MRMLFLDDSPDRRKKMEIDYPQTVFCETVRACTELLKLNQWEYVWLDHDLGSETFVDSDRLDCGMQVVRYILLNPVHKDTYFVVHTWNIPAGQRMSELLRGEGYKVTRQPFGTRA